VSVEGAKPDLIFVRLVHQALRIDGSRLLASVAALDTNNLSGRLPAIRGFFDQYQDQLRLHHSHEDELFFPAVEARVGADRMRLVELTQQHETLDSALVTVSDTLGVLGDGGDGFDPQRANACDAISAMEEALASHLDLEEATVLPLVESELSVADYKRLETQARHATPRDRAQFLIPWIVAHATPGQQQALFRSAPPLRFVSLIARRRYRRLDLVGAT
jgi:hemerythrin-like domain-containing protein